MRARKAVNSVLDVGVALARSTVDAAQVKVSDTAAPAAGSIYETWFSHRGLDQDWHQLLTIGGNPSGL